MELNLDIILVLAFLTLNLGVGLYFGQGVKNIKEFAIGNRRFATATIAATVISTWISGSFFTVSISQLYQEGVWFLPAAVGDILSLLIISYFLAPRMKQFLGHLSVAETMGSLYGSNIRIVTAIASLAQSIAMTALQIKVFSIVFSYFLHFSSTSATIISSFVVIVYSAWGGIKSVTITDVVQFFTFGMLIPLFAVFVWQSFGNMETLSYAMQQNSLLDISQLLNYKDDRFFPNLFLLLWFLIPSMSCPTFQRTLMARSTLQIRKAFNLAAFGYSFIILFICIIGLLILGLEPNLDPNNVVVHIIDSYSFTGLKGLTVIGIMAMVMSTADSWINIGSVIFSHDLCSTLGLRIKNELLVSRIFTVVIGFISVVMVLSTPSLFKLFSLQANFYMPIITMPLLLAILGFRTATRNIAFGMIAGLVGVIFWRIYMTPITGIDSVVPGMMFNLVTFISLHYLTGSEGGFIGGDDDLKKKLSDERQRKWKSCKELISSILQKCSCKNILAYCQNNQPTNQLNYTYFALVNLLSILVSISLDDNVYQENIVLLNSFQMVIIFTSAIFLGHKVWPTVLKEKYIGLIWHIALFVCLALISSFLVMMSNLSEISLVVLILHLTLIGLLIHWNTALVMVIAGVWMAFELHQILEIPFKAEIGTLKKQISYFLIAITGFMIAFFKPKQEQEALIRQQKAHMDDKLLHQKEQLQKALDLKYDFLRNLEHEAHTPITGITTLGMVLYDNYDKLDDEQVRQGLKDISQSATRLTSLVNNLIGLSTLSKQHYALNLSEVNLTELVHQRVKTCKKLYLDEEKNELLNITTNVADSITAKLDHKYIIQLLDNIIINAIQHCPEGNIVVQLNSDAHEITFKVIDEGVGIDKTDLYDIFGAFIVSSRTKTPSGGRGVGLALCKKIVELHHGKIWAEQNKEEGSTFIVTLPLEN